MTLESRSILNEHYSLLMLDPSTIMSVLLRPSVARVLRDYERMLKPTSRVRAPLASGNIETRWLLLGWATASWVRGLWGLRENKASG